MLHKISVSNVWVVIELVVCGYKNKRRWNPVFTQFNKLCSVGMFEKHAINPLGGCPRIAIFAKVEAFWKNKHSHIVNIASIIFSKYR